ncbi:MAG: hypothetical protein KGI78_00440 [Patescibacteria group bacterium]|nr:hypothetical protein [Patescibacteria group bacterium]MDE2057307.1 hypothetical protein [Patescibacteria group bacterium]
MKPERAIKAIKDGVGIARVSSFWNSADHSGRVHDTQVRTVIDCMDHLLKKEQRWGHILGAMQSGKTTTSLALQWAGPITYLMTGRRPYPFYIISSQTNHEAQTETELNRFLAYYENIDFQMAEGHEQAGNLDPMFVHSPSLATYREHVLRNKKDFAEAKLEKLLHRRVAGKNLQRIVEITRDATAQGYEPLMIIDEPQFGASDRLQVTEDGVVERKCVLEQIFGHIEEAIGVTREDHWLIGLSATPFEFNDMQRVWQVRQFLSANYSGFNYFAGDSISPDVTITPPQTFALSGFADSVSIPFVAQISMPAYAKPESFERYALQIGYGGTHAEYRADVEKALRDMIYKLLDQYKNDDEWPIGLCVRAFNSNLKTEELIAALKLDPERIDIIKYYSNEMRGIAVKRAVAERKRDDLPFIMFVTNRARMADAFPTRVRFFMDFGKMASDLNSLLQGLLGRACGYNKKSTVVLSDANYGIVESYVATEGEYIYRTSRHTVTMGGYRRGAPTSMVKFRIEMDDSLVQSFFERIDKEVVGPNIPFGESMSVPRQKGEEPRRGPILQIAEEVGLFDHAEEPSVRAEIFPQIVTKFRIARKNNEVRHGRHLDTVLRYDLDAEGKNCRYTFRWPTEGRSAGARGGAPGRAKGKKDSGQHMEPTIYVEKYDPKTGEAMNDKKSERRPGAWRAFMVTFPLIDPVREVRSAEAAYPVARSPYDPMLTGDERHTRDTSAGAGTP